MRMLDPSRFAMVPRANIARSRFDVEFVHKTTFSPDFLIPFYIEEIVPGDSLNVRAQLFARLAPTIVPVMDTMVAETFFFYVPDRLCWTNFAKFMGERETPGDSVEYLRPTVTFDQTMLAPGSLADYFGITINAVGSVSVQANPFRAYALIWNEFFRDPALQPAIVVDKGDGPDNPAVSQVYAVQRRNKRPDYFTSARPWPSAPLPGLGASSSSFERPGAGVPVTGLGVLGTANPSAGGPAIIESGNRSVTYPFRYSMSQASTAYMRTGAGTPGATPQVLVLIEDIRMSLVVQHYLEAAARGGTRYTEILQSIWGVSPPDFRLQRPEYLGGGRTFVTVSPITQTMASPAAGNTDWTTKMGEQSGVATINGNHGFSHSFAEHGWVIGLVSIRANITYQQGINRMWFRRTPFDSFSPPLEGLGEQAILRREIYADGVTANDTAVFGYQERWSEYKYKPSRTSGYFRSTASTPLDMWHLAQKFGSAPVLNSAFIAETMPLARVAQVSVNYGQAFLADFYVRESKTRAMRMYSIPGVMGRF